MEVVTFLNAMFSTFDRILDKYGIHKVEVLGDAFFVVGGCPIACDDHAERCVNAALEMLAHMPVLRVFAGADISMRVGVHTGPVMAGVVGSKDPRYHLFGATVPMANSMESTGEPGQVHVSWATYNRLQVNQEARARRFVDAVREMFPGAGSGADGGSAELETHTPTSHSVAAYPRISLRGVNAALRERSAQRAPGGGGIAGSEVDADFGGGVGDGDAGRAAPISHRVASLLSAEAIGGDENEDDIVIVPEEGDDAMPSQVQMWRRGAFLGWDIEANLVQDGFIYSRGDLPLMLAMGKDDAAAQSPPRASAFSVDGPAPKLHGVGFGSRVGSPSAEHARHLHAARPVHLSMKPPRSVPSGLALTSGRIGASALSPSGGAHEHEVAAAGAGGVNAQQPFPGVLLRTVSTLEKAAVGLAGKLDLARSEIYRGLMSHLRSARVAPSGTGAGSMRGGGGSGGPESSSEPPDGQEEGMRGAHPSGLYVPDDPYAFFGPGGGFFSFVERPALEAGQQPTFFVRRADPPLMPELAQAIQKLNDFIHVNAPLWVASEVASAHQQDA